MDVEVYDTTLRDGTQAESISFSVEDKLKIVRRLDEMGFDYVEGGWPGSNPKDVQFFERARDLRLKTTRLAAFGSTRRKGTPPEEDVNLRALVEANTPTVTIFGKSWMFHVTHALKVSPEENLRMIGDSIAYLRAEGREVLYDAEHFFDGFRADPVYALETLLAAQEAGARCIVLCDTNGGSLPWHVEESLAAALGKVTVPLGIHAHNDAACGVANSLAAVKMGARHVQGTVNGYGERCGNADLCAVIADLQLKMGKRCLAEDNVRRLTSLSHYVTEIANLIPNDHQPFVGRSAFAHKGGVHVDAVMKDAVTYEHVRPELVGNERRVLVSELAGTSNIRHEAERLGFSLEKGSPESRRILHRVKELEHEGYEFEGAGASFELLVRRELGSHEKLFDVRSFRVIVEERGEGNLITEATLKLSVGGEELHTVAEGDGPVHALDNALRKALALYYPHLADLRLTDFKVRIVDLGEGTASKVRVLLDSTDGQRMWTTLGVSTNIIEASWHALLESVEYGLLIGDSADSNGE